MRIYTPSGDVPFELSTFPDGQPHMKLLADPVGPVTVEGAIRNPIELFDIVMACHLTTAQHLDIRYLMGARMDRQIDSKQPLTLQVVTEMIASEEVPIIRVLDPHSAATCVLLNNENRAKGVYPHKIFHQVMTRLGSHTAIIVPDKGAIRRVEALAKDDYDLTYCKKVRDPANGYLSQFRITHGFPVYDKDCLIVDDICDGGGTFSGLAHVLRKEGARSVKLFVTHGIFSKGLSIAGIDHIYTTDSYCHQEQLPIHAHWLTVFPIRMSELE